MDRRSFVSGLALGAASLQADDAGAASSPWLRRGTVPRAGGAIAYAMNAAALPKGATPLVMLPKLGGWIDDWTPLARELTTKFDLIAIDPPGHGRSRMATPPPTVQTLSESAAMIRGALEELGIERYTLIGTSLGGCIAATFAARWPTPVVKLVLISTAILPRQPLDQILADEAAVNPPIYDAAGLPLRRPPEYAARTFGLSAPFAEEMNRSRAAAGAWIRPSERGVRREGLTELLTRVEAPTLLVYGDSGTYLRFRAIAEQLVRNVRTAIVAGGGSFVHQQKPQETARVLREFLESSA